MLSFCPFARLPAFLLQEGGYFFVLLYMPARRAKLRAAAPKKGRNYEVKKMTLITTNMKHKLLSSVVIGAMTFSFLAPLALADHGGSGGDHGGSGRSDNAQVQNQTGTVMQAGTVNGQHGDNGNDNSGNTNDNEDRQFTPIATSTIMQTASGTVATSSMKRNDEGQEQENENNNQQKPTNAALQALIDRLTEIVVRLEAELQALLGEVAHAPVISAVSASNVSSTGASISWTTDELTTGKVNFATSSPANVATATVVSDTVFSMNHTVALTGLNASTTYFYFVEAKDGAGNVSHAVESSFTTLPVPVVISVPPVISAITVTNVSSTRAQVNWQTNTAASSQVFFSATSPVNLSTASSSAPDSTLVTSHSAMLTGIAASSTVFFVIQSGNAGGIATSTQQSFATTP
jgi:hypothetical protein